MTDVSLKATTMTGTPNSVTGRVYPESRLLGLSRDDNSLVFFAIINGLVDSNAVVLDFGAGRGRQIVDATNPIHARLKTLKGKVRRLIGVDVDPAVLSNPYLDEAHVLGPDFSIPLPDASVDFILSDWVIEHVEKPEAFVAEVRRVLKPGGFFCARTPARYGYIALGARMLSGALEERVLSVLQPKRKGHDVFPKHYRMNTRRAIERWFGPAGFDTAVWSINGHPGYGGNSWLLTQAFRLFHWMTPGPLGVLLLVFARKR